jgi:hypothetical protein
MWYDRWNDSVLHHSYPKLFSYAKNRVISVSATASVPLVQDLFHLPLSNEAYLQFQQLSVTLQSLHLDLGKDDWHFTWGSSSFHSKRIYKFLIGHRAIHPAYKWLWQSCCQNKRKFFFWLILKDRLSTRGLLKRRNMHL